MCHTPISTSKCSIFLASQMLHWLTCAGGGGVWLNQLLSSLIAQPPMCWNWIYLPGADKIFGFPCYNLSNLFTATIFSLPGYSTCPERIPTETATPWKQNVSTYITDPTMQIYTRPCLNHSFLEQSPSYIKYLTMPWGFRLACSLAQCYFVRICIVCVRPLCA